MKKKKMLILGLGLVILLTTKPIFALNQVPKKGNTPSKVAYIEKTEVINSMDDLGRVLLYGYNQMGPEDHTYQVNLEVKQDLFDFTARGIYSRTYDIPSSSAINNMVVFVPTESYMSRLDPYKYYGLKGNVTIRKGNLQAKKKDVENIRGLEEAVIKRTAGMKKLDKLKWIDDWLSLNLTYDYSFKNYTPYDALETGKTVCNGYAELFKILAEGVGIPTEMVVGDTKNENHGWIISNVDGVNYYIDPTWNDSEDKGKSSREYFSTKPIHGPSKTFIRSSNLSVIRNDL